MQDKPSGPNGGRASACQPPAGALTPLTLYGRWVIAVALRVPCWLGASPWSSSSDARGAPAGERGGGHQPRASCRRAPLSTPQCWGGVEGEGVPLAAYIAYAPVTPPCLYAPAPALPLFHSPAVAAVGSRAGVCARTAPTPQPTAPSRSRHLEDKSARAHGPVTVSWFGPRGRERYT